MSAERAGPFESFTALLALEHLLRRVHGPVLRQTDLVAEGFVAQLAGKWPFTVVRPPRMYLESMRRAEHLVTLDAAVDVAERMGMVQTVRRVSRMQSWVTRMNAA